MEFIGVEINFLFFQNRKFSWNRPVEKQRDQPNRYSLFLARIIYKTPAALTRLRYVSKINCAASLNDGECYRRDGAMHKQNAARFVSCPWSVVRCFRSIGHREIQLAASSSQQAL